MIEVHMGGGEHCAAGVMLCGNEFFGQIWAMMVVNHRKGAHDYLVFIDGFGDKVIANQIAHGLGSVPVALRADGAVEF